MPIDALTFFSTMKKAMDIQAEEVWDMVEYSRSDGYRLRLGEVTLTELNFFRLRDYWTKGVYIRTNEPHEPTTGADWEWVIGHGHQWIQIRVQAKMIDRAGSFSQLGHGPSGARGQQMDRLIDPPPADVACRWVPLYVFYTATPPAKLQGTQARQTGCSAHLARTVRDNYGPHNGRARLTAAVHLPGSIRWSSIFDGLTNRLSAGESLATIIGTLADQALPRTVSSIGDFWDPAKTAGTCHGGLPPYIRAIVEDRDDDFDDARLATLEVEFPGAQGDIPTVKIRTETGILPRVYREPRRGDDDAFAPLASRRLVLDSPRGEDASLPNFVSVIDIDKLPEISR